MVRPRTPGRIYGYLRVSTDDQADSGLGLQAQRDAIEATLGKHNERVDEWFTDAGISGGAGLEKRPGLLQLIDRLADGDVLIVAKRDRLARDVMLAAWLTKEAKRRGARIMSADNPNAGDDDPAGELLNVIVDAFAQYERRLIQARTRAALDAKRRRGEKLGGFTPYGHRAVRTGDKPARLRRDAGEQAVVRRVLGMRAKGASYGSIANKLNADGVPAKGGGEWFANTVRRVIKRETEAAVTA